MKSDDLIGRGWAASELGKIKNNSIVIRALKNSARKDPFWWVRKEALNAVSKLTGEKSQSFLLMKTRD